MPLSPTSVTVGHIEYEPTVDGHINVHVDDKLLLDAVNWCLNQSVISVGNLFKKYSKQIKFVPQAEELRLKVFDAIKQIKINNTKEY